MWAQQIRNDEFPVVEFNAWESDFTDNAMVALCAELTNQLRNYDKYFGKAESLKQDAIKVIKKSFTATVKVTSIGSVDISPLTDKSDALSNYTELKNSIKKFGKIG